MLLIAENMSFDWRGDGVVVAHSSNEHLSDPLINRFKPTPDVELTNSYQSNKAGK